MIDQFLNPKPPHEWDLEDILNSRIEVRHDVIKVWNEAYRTGAPITDDQSYDTLIESLPIDDPLRHQVGFNVDDSRKSKLPIPMFSMDKIKTMEELKKWLDSKKIRPDERVLITPKYDGLSFLVHASSQKAFTRGNGIEGQKSDAHFHTLRAGKKLEVPEQLENRHLIGEVIMPRATFESKYSEAYRNPRNLVAGLFNNKTPQEALQDVHFMAYGVGEEREAKSELLKSLNEINTIPVPFESKPISELSDEYLKSIFAQWNLEFEIDGLIIEIDDPKRRAELGREKNNNPCYARAWKGFEASAALSVIQGIQYQIAKDGRLSVVGQLKPIELDGVTVSNVTLNNAGMMLERGWGIGAEVRVIRSGMVIPKIVATDKKVKPELPEHCPSCQSKLQWNSSQVHLMCRNKLCQAQQVQNAIAFFKIMEIDEVGEKIVEQLFAAGYQSIEKILKMTTDDFLALDRFAEKRAKLIHDNIQQKCQGVKLEQVQHASGLFEGLGTKRLALVSRFNQPEQTPDLETLMSIDGFSDITARAYLKGIAPFWDFLSRCPIQIATPSEAPIKEDGLCSDMRFCFTGFRDKAMQEQILREGGEVLSGVSKKTTHVVTKDPQSQSSKIKKARDLGILIWGPEDLRQHLKNAIS